MPDALDTLRTHADLKAAERAALDYRPIQGRATRAAVASLLGAILLERVDGFHAEPGDWPGAGRQLLEQELRAGLDEKLLNSGEAQRGRAAAASLYCPSKLLLLWGDTRKAIEGRRTAKALASYNANHSRSQAA